MHRVPFDLRVEKIPGVECWIWTGPIKGTRYGGFSGDLYAHRVAYERVNGKIPDGMFVCHKCDVPLCVNPAHLFVGTARDNHNDMKAKGRSASGEAHGMSKLKLEQVRAIRDEYAAGGVTQQELADKYRISQTMVGLITRGENWCGMNNY